MAKAVLYDSTLCVGCRQCEEACAAKWKLPYNEKIAAEEKLSANKLTTVRTFGDRFSRKLCMHCQDPACASVCPVAALKKTELGPVVYDETRCMGCRYCMVACPFQVPVYTWDLRLPVVRKCDLCKARLSQAGGVTCCTEACGYGATITGERDDLIAEARKRIREKPADYYPKIYGMEEAGGTSVLVISAVPFDQIGYNVDLYKSPLPALTWNALSHIPDIVVMGSVLLGGVYWVTHRREDVAEREGRK
jgi:formate dehydrogenase iron-sulfur subunit